MSRNTIANLTLTGILLTGIAAIVVAFMAVSWLLFGGIVSMHESALWSNDFVLGAVRVILSGPAMLVTVAFFFVLSWAAKITRDWKRGI